MTRVHCAQSGRLAHARDRQSFLPAKDGTVDSEPFLILAEEKNSDKVKAFREVDRNSFPLRQVLGTVLSS